ncbi:hypothetical protein [Clostridium sp. ATCC 25772]|uniref:hypothetical protein n=1 Tax=Clostridium sp. ATCC 25772 TaxID=1676991 RepID=UPI000782BD88|nr:hypothetical protein [Clostridium sp. ATCC 25772]
MKKEEIYIVDFKLENEEIIKQYFYKWIESRRHIPKNFTKEIRLMSVRPYYMPCYVCDLKIELDYTIRVQKRYKIRRGMSTIIDDNEMFYVKDYSLFASQVIPRYDMDQISPYDFSKMSISGYETKQVAKEKFIQVYDDCINHYKGAVMKKLEDVINKKLLKENTKEMKKKFYKVKSYEIINEEYYKVLVPVWVCKYSYNMTTYYCIFNGQSGKEFGHTPSRKIDKIFISVVIFLIIMILAVFLFIYIIK